MMGGLLKRFPLWGEAPRKALPLIALTFALDQASKIWLIEILEPLKPPRISITPFFDLVMAWNRGVSYGLLRAESVWGWLGLIIFTLLAMTCLWIWLGQSLPYQRARIAGLALILGGAFGNLSDRIFYGAVADFFSLHAFGYYWYVFNIADVAITIGFFLILADELKPRRDTQNERRESEAP